MESNPSEVEYWKRKLEESQRKTEEIQKKIEEAERKSKEVREEIERKRKEEAEKKRKEVREEIQRKLEDSQRKTEETERETEEIQRKIEESERKCKKLREEIERKRKEESEKKRKEVRGEIQRKTKEAESKLEQIQRNVKNAKRKPQEHKVTKASPAPKMLTIKPYIPPVAASNRLQAGRTQGVRKQAGGAFVKTLSVPLVPNYDPSFLLVRENSIRIYSLAQRSTQNILESVLKISEKITTVGHIKSGQKGRNWLIVVLNYTTIRIYGFRSFKDARVLNEFQIKDAFDNFAAPKELISGLLAVSPDNQYFVVHGGQSLFIFKKIIFEEGTVDKLLKEGNTVLPHLFHIPETVRLPLVDGASERDRFWGLSSINCFDTHNSDLGIMISYNRALVREPQVEIASIQYTKNGKSSYVTHEKFGIENMGHSIIHSKPLFNGLGCIYICRAEIWLVLDSSYGFYQEASVNRDYVQRTAQEKLNAVKMIYTQPYSITSSVILAGEQEFASPHYLLLGLKGGGFVLSEIFIERHRGSDSAVLRFWTMKEYHNDSFGEVGFMTRISDFVVHLGTTTGVYIVKFDVTTGLKWEVLQHFKSR